MYMHIYMHIYIYIYIERERETYVVIIKTMIIAIMIIIIMTHIYIYIYILLYSDILFPALRADSAARGSGKETHVACFANYIIIYLYRLLHYNSYMR